MFGLTGPLTQRVLHAHDRIVLRRHCQQVNTVALAKPFQVVLTLLERARAWLAGRDYVGPEDIQTVAPDVLRHRLVLSFEAEADGVTPDSIIERVLDGVGVP